jgi:hypothetical protein
MLKRLAIFTAFLAVMQAAIPMPRVAAGPESDASAEAKGNAQSGNQPSSTAAPATFPQQVCSPTINYARQKEQGKDGWDEAAVFANYLLVTVGIFGIVYAALTLGKLKEQTEAVRDSVQAQEKAMKLAVNARRPYLVICVESQLPNQFVFAAKNEGQTPARIESIWSKLLMADRDGTLQIPSNEEMAKSVISTPPQLLPPKGTCTVYFCDEHRLNLMRGDAFCEVYFHGRIRYSNTLEVDPVRPYETKWLYSQLPLKGKLSIPRPDARRPEHNTWT